MTKLKLYIALIVMAAVNHSAKWLLVPTILVLGFLGTAILYKIHEVAEFILPMVNSLLHGPEEMLLSLVLLSYTLLIFAIGVLFKKIAFLAAVKLYNRHNSTLIP